MEQDDGWFAASVALTPMLLGIFFTSLLDSAAMDSLGLALIVGGAAFVVSGLVFLLPGTRRRQKQQKVIDESRKEIDFHLRAMRRHRGDIS